MQRPQLYHWSKVHKCKRKCVRVRVRELRGNEPSRTSPKSRPKPKQREDKRLQRALCVSVCVRAFVFSPASAKHHVICEREANNRTKTSITKLDAMQETLTRTGRHGSWLLHVLLMLLLTLTSLQANDESHASNKRFSDHSVHGYMTERTCWWNEVCKEEFQNLFRCKCPQYSYCRSPGRYYNAYCSMTDTGYIWTQLALGNVER